MNTLARSYAHAFVAALLPGAGLFFAGLKTQGAVLLLTGFFFAAGFFVHSLSDHYAGWLICMLAPMIVSLASCFVCLLSMKARRARRWWVLLALLPVCLIVGSICASVLNRIAGFRPFRVAGESMSPAVYKDEAIIVDKTYYDHHSLHDGDLIVFQHGDATLIKRVSALPGETIEGKQGTIFRNNVALTEPYAIHDAESPLEVETFPVRTVPEGQIFVTGDNRDFSLDSRSDEYGPVYVSDVMGRLCFIYASRKHNRIGRNF